MSDELRQTGTSIVFAEVFKKSNIAEIMLQCVHFFNCPVNGLSLENAYNILNQADLT